MKKTYINPEIAVVKIGTQQMLASSTIIGLSEDVVTNEEDLLAREFDDFDDSDDVDIELGDEEF